MEDNRLPPAEPAATIKSVVVVETPPTPPTGEASPEADPHSAFRIPHLGELLVRAQRAQALLQGRRHLAFREEAEGAGAGAQRRDEFFVIGQEG